MIRFSPRAPRRLDPHTSRRPALLLAVLLASPLSVVIGWWPVASGASAEGAATVATAPSAPHAVAGVDPNSAAWVPFASSFSRPIAIRHAGDQTGRLFIAEQGGRIWVTDAKGHRFPDPFLDLSEEVNDTGLEQGLLGLAFHPAYASNQRFFVAYTRASKPGTGFLVVFEYLASNDPDRADPASARAILGIEIPTEIHNGGNILFGPDGYLYLGVGDGGPARDPENNAQDPSNLLGAILRLDIDSSPPREPSGPASANRLVDGHSDAGTFRCGLGPLDGYTIPADNPFVEEEAACAEIWTFGWRHPWRWSFDRATGDLLVGDVGQGDVEEVSLIPVSSTGGENYGWSCMEGDLPTGFNRCRPGPLTDPQVTYRHDDPTNPQVGLANCAITGGYRYRGQQLPELDGIYFFGDYCSGRIWATDEIRGVAWDFDLWEDTRFRIASFGEDERGELYLADHRRNVIFRLAAVVFTDGFESGDASAWSNTALHRPKSN